MKSQREIWGESLVDIAHTDDTVLVIDGDLANSTRADLFAQAHPDRFIEVGIAEQNMVGIAFGLSTLGYRPWLSTFGVFLTHRALDPIRMLVSQTRAPVRLAGAYSGLLNGSSGKTHQDIEDLAIMRAMPFMTVIAPADEIEAAAVVRWACTHDGPVYIRLARDAVRAILPADYTFELGRVITLRDGGTVALVSTGVQSTRVLEAAEILAAEGVEVRVLHVPTIKPLDEQSLIHSLRDCRRIFTIEEHTVIGGLGGLIAETMTTHGLLAPLTRLGLADSWSESGPNEFLLDKYGLSATQVAAQVLSELAAVALIPVI